MKRTIILSGFIIAMLVANNLFAQTKKVVKTTAKKTTTVVKKTTTTAVVKKPGAAELEEGKQLLSKADCLACHNERGAKVGPQYIDVAKKYPASEENYDKLTKKVIAGGTGVWGQIPMAAHPSIPPADIKKMVEYILSLK